MPPVELNLFDYQETDLAGLREKFRQGMRAPIYVAPCGAGKTTTCAKMVRTAVSKGLKVLFIAHLRALVGQCSERLESCQIEHGVIMSESGWMGYSSVMVCSRDTLIERIRNGTAPAADLVIVDEAHHATSDVYQEVLRFYASALFVGLSATPSRLDGSGLGDVFDSMVTSLTKRELIARGRLVPTKVYAPSQPDLSKAGTSGTDYNKKDLEEIFMRPKLVGDLVEHHHRLSIGRRALGFAPTRKASAHFVDAYNANGLRAVHLEAKDKDGYRKEVLARLAAFDLDIVWNVGLFTEGVDCPFVDTITLARSTYSLSLYLQMIGRGERWLFEKLFCLVLDHANCTRRHGFSEEDREWSLEAKAYIVKKIKGDTSPSVRICGNPNGCMRAYQSGEGACPDCGWKPETRDEGRVEKGDLAPLEQGDVNSKEHGLSKNPKIRRLQMIAREFGFKPGWLWRNIQAVNRGDKPDIPQRARIWIEQQT